MNKKLVWSKESLLRLQEIEDYIAKDNPKVAIEFVNKIIERVESIILHHQKGRIVPEILFSARQYSAKINIDIISYL